MVITFGDGDRVREFAAGIDVAEQDVDDRIAAFLAGVVGREDGADVGVRGEGQRVYARGVRDDDGVSAAEASDVGDDGGGVPIVGEGGAVECFGGKGFEEHETDVGRGVDAPEVVGAEYVVVGEVLDSCAVSGGSGPDGGEWGDEIGVSGGAGSAADVERSDVETEWWGLEYIGSWPTQTIGGVRGRVSKDTDVEGVGKWEDVVCVFEKDGAGGADSSDE